MTDNEIIKALDFCCGNIAAAECTEDLCYQSVLPESRNGETRWCRQWLIKDALDLIHRLQEQNAALISGQEALWKCIAEKDAQIERLQKNIPKSGFFNLLGNCLVYSENLKDYNDMRKGLKSEAIKAFECQILDLFPADKDFTTISRFTIKQKAKEMVGTDE